MPVVSPPVVYLPPLRASWSGISTTDTAAQLKNAKLRWGALGLSSDSVFISPSITQPVQIRIDGGFQAERGSDRLSGKSFFFDLDKQSFRGETVSIRHDIFRIDASLIVRNPSGLSLSDVTVVDNVPGEGRTLSISASSLAFRSTNGQWNIQNLGLNLYKTHILTVPKVRFHSGGSAAASRATRFQLPLSVRQSAISGPVATIAYATQPATGVGAAFVFEQTTKRGDAASAAISYEKANQKPKPAAESSDENAGLPLGDMASLLSEPPAVKRDVSPRLTLPSVLGAAIGSTGTSAISVTAADRQEVIRRYKTVLVDNKPMLAVSSSWVFGPTAIEAHFESGNRLETDLKTSVASYRNKSSFRLRSSAVIAKQRIPFEMLTVRVNALDHYAYNQIAADLLPKRVGIPVSVSLAVRDIHGKATYYSDFLEAPSELQLRYKMPIAGWQVALGSRLDLTSDRFFDTEVVVAAPGRVVRPEFRYRTRGNQFALNIAMPFFSL